MKKIIYITLALVLSTQHVHATTLRAVASVEENDSLLISADDSREEQIRKLQSAKREIVRLRAQVEEKRKEVRDHKIYGVVGIGMTLAAGGLIRAFSNGDLPMVVSAFGGLFSMALGVFGLGTAAKNGYMLYIDSDKLDTLEKQLADLEASIQQQINELN